MSPPPSSLYRDALQVSPERIAALRDEDLNVLITQLFRAQAYRCGSPLSRVMVNTEGKAKDDGSDGWSNAPEMPDPWLGATDTCWQLKAGVAGEPSRIAGEVAKRIPSETLAGGGRFVVVASGSTNGRKGEEDRHDALVAAARAAGIPLENIEVIGSERLANWCNEHPAIAACWAGRPAGLWSLDDWSSSEEHQVPWQAAAAVQSDLEARRADLDFAGGDVHHLHIQGPPGVGKTRFALELCRGAAWCGAVIYVRQAADLRLAELLDSAAADAGAKLMVVADEVQADQLRPLRDSVGRGSGRIRLITIGHSPTPDSVRIPALSVKPLDREMMTGVVKGWYAAMPPEHVDFVVRFADGFVRLARLAADAVTRDPRLDVRRLLDRDEIRLFLDSMLGTGERRALYVVAVLSRVGWTEEVQGEGEAVARHLRQDWDAVRFAVDGFNRRFGIAPRGGRYRYISPTPLGMYLAVEAWTTYPELLKSLPDVLPSDNARDAYYERLQAMTSNQQAREYARAELATYSRIDDFVDARAASRWSALASADPAGAARNIYRALAGGSLEERQRIKDRARRETVWALVRIAWKPTAFHNAVKALALLAEAENETWGNNASNEFTIRFQIFLGGTAVPYLDRLTALDELLAEGRPALVRLVVKALTQVGNREDSRSGGSPASDELPEQEWRPRNGMEFVECVESGITKLTQIAQLGITDIQADLVAAAKDVSTRLREQAVRNLVAGFFEAVRRAYPEAREPLRRIIASLIDREQRFLMELQAEEIAELEALHARFEDDSLAARLQQYVGQSPWGRVDLPDLKPLAEELLSRPECLAEHWPWLTSGDASDAWRLGCAVAEVDAQGDLADTLPTLAGCGRDLRLLCGYIAMLRQTLGDNWYDRWVTSQFERTPRPVELLLEVTWRCGATESLARTVAATLQSDRVNPQVVGQLGYGSWWASVTADSLEAVLWAMADTGHRDTAVGVLSNRMGDNPAEVGRWEPLALDLVTDSELIRSSDMANYYWKEIASTLIAGHAAQIAAAIFREQARRGSNPWSARHTEAKGILRACVEQDPHGVWDALRPFLESPTDTSFFCIGFPRGILERIPADHLRAWVAENPEERAVTVAGLVSKDVSSDETVAARILGECGDIERVAGAFFGQFITGSWSGPSSSHWQQIAEALEAVARSSTLPKLRCWAADSARKLHEMASRYRQREEEEALRWR